MMGMDVAKVIEDRLLELGLTDVEAERRSGVNIKTWRAIQRDPDVERRRDTLSGIARALEWRFNWLESLRAGQIPEPYSAPAKDLERVPLEDRERMADLLRRAALRPSGLSDAERREVRKFYGAVSSSPEEADGRLAESARALLGALGDPRNERPRDAFSLDERIARLPARDRALAEAQVRAILDAIEAQEAVDAPAES